MLVFLPQRLLHQPVQLHLHLPQLQVQQVLLAFQPKVCAMQAMLQLAVLPALILGPEAQVLALQFLVLQPLLLQLVVLERPMLQLLQKVEALCHG